MMEYSTATGVKMAKRDDLPPGTYEFKDDGSYVRVDDDATSSYEAAANRMRDAIESLL